MSHSNQHKGVSITLKNVNTYEITLDGNDGTGKSTVIAALCKRGYVIKDRGLPTQLTDNPDLPIPTNGIYIILDVPVATSRKRLLLARRDLNEKYHTVDDLTHYRQRFIEITKMLPNARLIDADRSINEVVQDCVSFLQSMDISLLTE